MILALDIGNSQIFCGVFEGERLKVQVRYASKAQISSDEFGVFLRGALRENGVDPESIRTIGISSVVPELNYALRACSQKYFNVEPMILQPGVKTGLKVDYKDPKEVGSDRIADAIGAIKMFPNRDLILVDFGTATTVCAISKDKVFLGGNIMPGIRLSMEALEAKTSKLPSVEISSVKEVIGKTTVDSIRNGLYWSNVGMIKEITSRISEEVFSRNAPLKLATGGFSHLFDKENLFDHVVTDLILVGIVEALKINGYLDDSDNQ
jgi:type III pantothenate kinase